MTRLLGIGRWHLMIRITNTDMLASLSTKEELLHWVIPVLSDWHLISVHIFSCYLCNIVGICLAWTYTVCCRLPANTGHWHGYHAGAYHHNQEGIHHLGTSHLCTGWWLDWSRSRHYIRSLRRHHCIVTWYRWAGLGTHPYYFSVWIKAVLKMQVLHDPRNMKFFGIGLW